MATATIRSVWKDSANAYAAAVVSEGGKLGNVEYNASTPLLDAQGQPKDNGTLKADLTAALKAVRDAQTPAAPTVIGAISGNVNV